MNIWTKNYYHSDQGQILGRVVPTKDETFFSFFGEKHLGHFINEDFAKQAVEREAIFGSVPEKL